MQTDKTVELDGKKYPLSDSNFPTVNPDCPYEFTEDEKEVVRKLRYAFVSCEKLKKHINLLLNKGSLYKVTNSNLLFHGCIPMTADGGFRKTDILGNSLCGKALYDRLESCARKAFLSVNEAERKNGRDILWYLWNGADSPLYGRDKMTTFERYFIGDESTHIETKDIYYTLIDSRDNRPIGLWGQKRLRYIKRSCPILYTNLLTKCRLNEYLADIDEQAQKMYDELVLAFAKEEGCTEQLKATNQMLWVRKMNNATQRAREVVNTELIYN